MRNGDRGTCEAPRCKRDAVITYLGRDLCERHLDEAMHENDIKWVEAHPEFKLVRGLIVRK